MGEHRKRRGLVAAIAGAGLLSAAGATLFPAHAVADGGFDVVNGTVNAGGAYVVYFNGKFPNFSPGIIGSTFPLTHAHVDNSPFSEATASPADTGPAGGLVVSNYNTSPPPTPLPQTISQPQYVDSRYPPGSKPASIGSAPGPYATASSGATGASAQSADLDLALSQPAASTSSPSQQSAFNAAMAQWRAKYMKQQQAPAHQNPAGLLQAPAAATQHQTAATDPTPDGIQGLIGSSTTSIDAANGVVVTGDSRVRQASFGSGALVLHDVHTAVTITNNGAPQASIVTTVADANIQGVPVSIGKDGVTVASNVVPLDQVQAASAALNSALAAAGITVHAVAPQIVTSTSEETVTATAVSVTIDQPGPPEQTVVVNLGNVFADDLAIPSQAVAASLDNGLSGALSSSSDTLTPPTTTNENSTATMAPVTTPVTPPAGVSPGTGGTSKPKLPSTAPAAAVAAAKPAWLLAAYLLWQLLIIATLASLWWWRSTARRLPGAPS